MDVAAEFAQVFKIMAGDMRTRIEVGKSLTTGMW